MKLLSIVLILSLATATHALPKAVQKQIKIKATTPATEDFSTRLEQSFDTVPLGRKSVSMKTLGNDELKAMEQETRRNWDENNRQLMERQRQQQADNQRRLQNNINNLSR